MSEDLTPHRLSFCSISIIEKDIAEIILDEGVEVNVDMLDEFWSAVDSKMNTTISILLNKKATYSYQFDALIAVSESIRINRVAVISYDQISTNISSYMKTAFNKSGKEIEIFESKEAALHWLYKTRS